MSFTNFKTRTLKIVSVALAMTLIAPMTAHAAGSVGGSSSMAGGTPGTTGSFGHGTSNMVTQAPVSSAVSQFLRQLQGDTGQPPSTLAHATHGTPTTELTRECTAAVNRAGAGAEVALIGARWDNGSRTFFFVGANGVAFPGVNAAQHLNGRELWGNAAWDAIVAEYNSRIQALSRVVCVAFVPDGNTITLEREVPGSIPFEVTPSPEQQLSRERIETRRITRNLLREGSWSEPAAFRVEARPNFGTGGVSQFNDRTTTFWNLVNISMRGTSNRSPDAAWNAINEAVAIDRALPPSVEISQLNPENQAFLARGAVMDIIHATSIGHVEVESRQWQERSQIRRCTQTRRIIQDPHWEVIGGSIDWVDRFTWDPNSPRNENGQIVYGDWVFSHREEVDNRIWGYVYRDRPEGHPERYTAWVPSVCDTAWEDTGNVAMQNEQPTVNVGNNLPWPSTDSRFRVLRNQTIVTPIRQDPFIEDSLYQILSVNCNQNDFNSAIAGAGTAQQNTLQHGLAVTPRISSRVWGNGGSREITRTTAFYSRECPLQCSSDPSQLPGAIAPPSIDLNSLDPNVDLSIFIPEHFENTDGSLISSVNTNIRNTGSNGNRWGIVHRPDSQSGLRSLNDADFTFFRDNIPREVNVDVWFPINTVNNGVGIIFDNRLPVTTTVVREDHFPWQSNRPNSLSTREFAMRIDSATGRRLFDNPSNISAQFSGNATPNQVSRTVEILPGLHRRFWLSSRWATPDANATGRTDRPNYGNTFNPQHSIGVMWEYDVRNGIRIPMTNIGFNNGNPSFNLGTTTAYIQGRCFAHFGTTTHSDLAVRDIMHRYTGSDRSFMNEPYLGLNNNAVFTVRFLRSVSE